MEKFYEDSYLKKIKVKVVDEKLIRGIYFYRFDNTILYGGGGGQDPDDGKINGRDVVDIFEDESGVWYGLREKIDSNGEILMELNWEKRYSLMMNHTSQHLISGLFENLYGFKTLSAHIGADYFSVELSSAEVDGEMINVVEMEAFSLIGKNLKVKKYLMDFNEAKKLPLRKISKEFDGSVRIVEIDGFDYSLCKGLHVDFLGEIGVISFYKRDKVRKNIRLYFKSGKNALGYLLSMRDSVKRVALLYNFSEEKLEEKFDKLVSEKKSVEKRCGKVEKKLVEKFLEDFSLKKDPIFEDLTFISERAIRNLAHNMKERGIFGILYGDSRIFLIFPEEKKSEIEAVIKEVKLRGFEKGGVIEVFEGGRELAEKLKKRGC